MSEGFEQLLNVGCGGTFDPRWINLDMNPSSGGVKKWDFRKGLPYPNNTFDMVYHSHVLEHLTSGEAQDFLKECHRVLKPGGTLRVVVPDLEQIAKFYLEKLKSVCDGNRGAIPEYEWMRLELFDQTTRSSPGGEMGLFLTRAPEVIRGFIKGRVGEEAETYWKKSEGTSSARPRLQGLAQKVRRKAASILVGVVAGAQDKSSFREGLFRNSGEIHRVMYDRFSLKQILEFSGFESVERKSPSQSFKTQFSEFNLDGTDQNPRKPDSLYMECRKPQ